MKKRNLSFLLFVLISMPYLNSQCKPPGSDICEKVPVLCSLDDFNGYTCANTTENNPTACLPCQGTGAPHNSSWWGFVTDGGRKSFTIKFSNCFNPSGGIVAGVQFGVVGLCDCSEPVFCEKNCVASGGSVTVSGDFIPCKTYYFWIDGCSGDVCNFTISTGGSKPDTLLSLGNIVSSIPNPICKGCCSDFSVELPTNGCLPEYVWSLDGKDLTKTSNKVNICFPDEGTFTLCVYAVIGRSYDGLYCSKTAPVCKKITVGTTANDNYFENGIQIIPNPNSGDFILNVDEGIQFSGLELVSIEGKVIDINSTKSGKNQYRIQTKKLESGIYQLKIRTKQNIFYKSMVIQ